MDMENLNQAMAAGAAAANAAAAANPAVAATMNLMGAAAVAFPPAGTVVAATSSAAPPGVVPTVANHAQPQVGYHSQSPFKLEPLRLTPIASIKLGEEAYLTNGAILDSC